MNTERVEQITMAATSGAILLVGIALGVAFDVSSDVVSPRVVTERVVEQRVVAVPDQRLAESMLNRLERDCAARAEFTGGYPTFVDGGYPDAKNTKPRKKKESTWR